MNERFEELADAEALGETLSAEELELLAASTDAEIAAERDFYVRLGGLGTPTADDVDDGDMARALETMAAFERHRATPKRRPWVIGLVAGGLAAAAALVITLTLPKGQLVESSDVGDAAVVSRGALLVDEARLAVGAEVPLDRWVVADGRTCVHVDEATTCVEAQARVRARKQGMEVESGTIDFEGQGRLLTPYGTLDAANATFQLQLTDEQMFITVTAGDVSLTDAKGRVLQWGAGDSDNVGSDGDVVAVAPTDKPDLQPTIVDDETEDAPEPATTRVRRAPQPSAGELLAQARQHRGSGSDGKALSTYAKLQRLYPKSAEARAADVSIGQLHLRRGKAKAALKDFDRYLKRGGPLAEEAHWGKIRALDKLGRDKARDAAIARLRAEFPGSVYVTRAEALAAD